MIEQFVHYIALHPDAAFLMLYIEGILHAKTYVCIIILATKYCEFIVATYRTRRRGLGAELQIDRIEGVPRAVRAEINIVFLMLGIIVRVELYEGCEAGQGSLPLSQRLSP